MTDPDDVAALVAALSAAAVAAAGAAVAGPRRRRGGAVDLTLDDECPVCLELTRNDDAAARRPTCPDAAHVCGAAGVNPDFLTNAGLREDAVSAPGAACRLEDFVAFLHAQNPDAEVVLACGHTFHAGCVAEFMSVPRADDEHLKCPMCKRPLVRCNLA